MTTVVIIIKKKLSTQVWADSFVMMVSMVMGMMGMCIAEWYKRCSGCACGGMVASVCAE